MTPSVFPSWLERSPARMTRSTFSSSAFCARSSTNFLFPWMHPTERILMGSERGVFLNVLSFLEGDFFF